MIREVIRKSIACLFVLIIASGTPLHLIHAAEIHAVLNDVPADEIGEAMLKDVPEYVDESLSSFNEPLTIQAYNEYKENSERIKQAALKKKQEQEQKKKKAAEAAKLKAAAAAEAAKARMIVSERELHLLARIVYAESRGEPFLGQVAVAAVVLNRVESDDFPDSIEAVIEQPLAFTAVDDGQYELQPDSTAYEAAEEALQGNDPTNGALYYFNPQTATSKWIWTRQQTIQIGRHVFAK